MDKSLNCPSKLWSSKLGVICNSRSVGVFGLSKKFYIRFESIIDLQSIGSCRTRNSSGPGVSGCPISDESWKSSTPTDELQEQYRFEFLQNLTYHRHVSMIILGTKTLRSYPGETRNYAYSFFISLFVFLDRTEYV